MKEKQIDKQAVEEMAKDIFEPKIAIDGIDLAFASVHGADKKDTHFMRIAEHLVVNKGYRKQSEWISVDERLPDTTLKRLIICDQDIGSGEVVNEEDGGMVQISAIVAVISRRCTGGEVKQLFDFDQTIDGVWAHNMSVTHWMPLPEPPKPKMKGGAE